MDSILKVIPTIQSVALVDRNLKLLKKKKKKSKDFVSAGVDTLVGASLIKAESDFLNN